MEQAKLLNALNDLCNATTNDGSYNYPAAYAQAIRVIKETEEEMEDQKVAQMMKSSSKSDSKNFLSILVENMQAQIAAYYNIDKTDAEREKRNAVIEEYKDLIAILKK